MFLIEELIIIILIKIDFRVCQISIPVAIFEQNNLKKNDMKATLFSVKLKAPKAIVLERLVELMKDSSKAKHIIELCCMMPEETARKAGK